MVIYKFYEPHTYTELMKRNFPEYVVDYRINSDFDPPYLEVAVSEANSYEFLKFSRKWVANPDDINKPTKVIIMSYSPGTEVLLPLDRYYDDIYHKEAVSFAIYGNKILLDVPIEFC